MRVVYHSREPCVRRDRRTYVIIVLVCSFRIQSEFLVDSLATIYSTVVAPTTLSKYLQYCSLIIFDHGGFFVVPFQDGLRETSLISNMVRVNEEALPDI